MEPVRFAAATADPDVIQGADVVVDCTRGVVVKNRYGPLGEESTERTLSFIHALAKQLLHVGPQELTVGVSPSPSGASWRVRVHVGHAFTAMEAEAVTLHDALDQMMRQLATAVSKHLEDMERVLAEMMPKTE